MSFYISIIELIISIPPAVMVVWGSVFNPGSMELERCEEDYDRES